MVFHPWDKSIFHKFNDCSDVMEEPVIGNTSLEETPPTVAHTSVDTIIEVPPIEVAMDFQKSLTLDDIDFSTLGNDTDA